jgi:hypothetical protein
MGKHGTLFGEDDLDLAIGALRPMGLRLNYVPTY